MLFFSLLWSVIPAFAQSEFPFQEFYGTYKIEKCELTDAVSVSSTAVVAPQDFCRYEMLQVRRSPSQNGAPHTQLLFTGKKLEDIWEAISPLIPDGKFMSYSKDSQGRTHHFVRTTSDKDGTYRYRDVWIHKTATGTKLSLKIRQTPSGQDKTLTSGTYEIELK